MKEENENNGMEGPAPDGNSPPPAAARAPLGDWRIAAFWMTCGALLVLLALGAFMLVQRVGVERDMMAVAATAAAPVAADPAPATGIASRTVVASPALATAPAMASPPAPAAAAPRIGADEARGRNALPDKPGDAEPGTATAAGSASPTARAGALAPRAKAPARPSGAKAAAKPPRQHAAARRSLKRSARSEVHTQEGNYARIFARCPLPGEPGSVECRRHICNGAESEGPACKPYRGRLR